MDKADEPQRSNKLLRSKLMEEAEPITEQQLKGWTYLRRKYRHKLGTCHKASLGYSCGGGNNYQECGQPYPDVGM